MLSSIGWGILCIFGAILIFSIYLDEIQILKEQIKEKKVRKAWLLVLIEIVSTIFDATTSTIFYLLISVLQL
ncbi:hypothetical protein [Thermaerobacillus caldiproteolyticus]|uniref:hypothetical protein n=1 Tax=Thermaerobacillus caldiproteolyticus TaxID=247480 RepID=UPI0018F1EE5F|nr:hypothetical protein [Anoxybacillus caldiproteolyticus]